jgi:hypothetical protein
MTSKEVELPTEEKTNVLPNDKSPSSPEPSHNMTGEYAALMETNGKECESWYYFIRRKGNEEALKHLQDQLEKVEWFILDDLSAFDLDLEHFVEAKTAKQMTKLELNSYAFHRKFDGKLEQIDFNFKKKDLRNNERMMCKVFDQIGYGQIEDYISDEDLDDEDLTDHESSSESDSEEDTEEDSTDSEPEEEISKKKPTRKLPPSLVKNDLPRFAKAKRRQHKKRT